MVRRALASGPVTPGPVTPGPVTPGAPQARVPALSRGRHTASAAATATAWLVFLTVALMLALFAGTALLLATLAVTLTGLAWSLDRLHRRAVPGAAPLTAWLTSVAAALMAVVGGTAAVWVWLGVVGHLWAWFLVVLGPLAAVTLTVAVARSRRPQGQALAVAGAGVAAVGCLILVVSSDSARDSLRAIGSELRPDLPADAPAAPPSPPTPSPQPTTVPSPTTPPEVPVTASRPCAATDLTLSATGWDSAMGTSAVTLVATNRAASACWLEGWPDLRLLQGGDDLRLDVGHPARGASGQPLSPRRVAVPPGGEASLGWWWKGYRQMADQRTPQTVVLSLQDGGEVRLGLVDPGHLVDVIEGAPVDVTPWQGTPAAG
jgi:hypothetical protein